ncbi:3,4-dihydroxy-2-butanone-4-phosphate synthase [Chryseobacterium sp. FH1]|uniref:3,4-dihydroxy-2-butanone-4-phosphate synthase n=1 Tax=Chryseobacterium sp. FH1 TaxID=1233951 RepID=UPI0004E2BC77|nr:3,4-dihydroxy-2-butanone-4-phosphate synthase [Chryseobacterium sp. FH1]KFC18860.1 3,4-dihydroxy-2-butanone 4-phosphate synthase [Chryseobacterium sp. FH1]
MDNFQLNTIEEALEDIKNGKMVIVVDDEDRENEGDLIAAAELTTPEMVNFMATHARGLICMPLTETRCDELELHSMVSNSTDPKETAFTISVDLLGKGATTGISAGDRAKTIQAIMDSNTKPGDLMRPGHIFPLRAREGGVLKRAGHTEAAVDLTRLAGLKEGGVICEILNEDGSMSRLPQLLEFGKKHDLKVISIEDLIHYRIMRQGDLVERIEEREIKTHFGDFKFYVFEEKPTEQIHYALTKGNWSADESVLVRVQSTGTYFDVFSRLSNGEHPLMQQVTDLINKEGKGAVVFINNVSNKENTLSRIKHFLNYQDGTSEQPTIAPNFRDYGIGTQILKDLGINKFKVITQNPNIKPILSGYDVEVTEMIAL